MSPTNIDDKYVKFGTLAVRGGIQKAVLPESSEIYAWKVIDTNSGEKDYLLPSENQSQQFQTVGKLNQILKQRGCAPWTRSSSSSYFLQKEGWFTRKVIQVDSIQFKKYLEEETRPSPIKTLLVAALGILTLQRKSSSSFLRALGVPLIHSSFYKQVPTVGGRTIDQDYYVGPLITLNKDYGGDHLKNPQLTPLEKGNFLAVWEVGRPSTQNPENIDIVGQLFNSNFERIGKEFLLTNRPTTLEKWPQLATLKGGRIVVCWDQQQLNSSDHVESEIFAQLMDPFGTNIGIPIPFNTHRDTSHKWSDVAGTSDGGFVITASSSQQDTGSRRGMHGVYQQRYTVNGTPCKSEESPVNRFLRTTQVFSRVAGSITKEEYSVSVSSDYRIQGIFHVNGKIFGRNGNPRSSEFPISARPITTAFEHSIVALDDRYVGLWDTRISENQTDVFGRHFPPFEANGWMPFMINKPNSSTINTHPGGALLTNENFVVTWLQKASKPGEDKLEEYSILAKIFNKTTNTSETFEVYRDNKSNEMHPTVIGLSKGGFVIVLDTQCGAEHLVSKKILGKGFFPRYPVATTMTSSSTKTSSTNNAHSSVFSLRKSGSTSGLLALPLPPTDNSGLYIGLGVGGGAFCLLASVGGLVRFLNNRKN